MARIKAEGRGACGHTRRAGRVGWRVSGWQGWGCESVELMRCSVRGVVTSGCALGGEGSGMEGGQRSGREVGQWEGRRNLSSPRRSTNLSQVTGALKEVVQSRAPQRGIEPRAPSKLEVDHQRV